MERSKQISRLSTFRLNGLKSLVRSSIENNANANRTRQRYARLAGFLYLCEIVLALGSGFVVTRIAGNGTFSETARRIAASEHLYRAALSVVVIVTLSSAVLAFALYVTLRPVNSLLAQLAMIFCLGDSFVAILVRMSSFVRLHYSVLSLTANNGASAAQEVTELLRQISGTTENIGGIAFGIGTLIFFYLFWRSNCIPRALAALGVAAAIVWTCLYFASLVFPEHHATFQLIALVPMALTDVLAGLYLLLFGINTGRYSRDGVSEVRA
ncbi:MAG: DUF4386 domain-containing protein [Candidatus Acidiferrales bacterium]